jgi:uncharacterized protein YcaQ
MTDGGDCRTMRRRDPGDRPVGLRDVNSLSPRQTRWIAIRAQALDGSAGSVLEVVRRLGFLQLDPIATVATAQELVLWSRLGPHDRTELDRLLWEEKKLFEWRAFIWPIEDLPLIRARMRQPWGPQKRDQWAKGFMNEQAGLRRYVLRELDRRGPLLSRDLEHHAARADERYVWWGTRAQLTWMLELLHRRGRIAVVGRRGGQRLWDLAERWYPETENVPLREAERRLAEKRRRALGVWLEGGRWRVHTDASADPVPTRTTLLSPFDRLIHDRDRAEALFGFRYRIEIYVPKANREYGYYVMPVLHGDRLVGRIDPEYDRKARVLRVNRIVPESGVRFPRAALERTLRSLARFLGAREVRMPAT